MNLRRVPKRIEPRYNYLRFSNIGQKQIFFNLSISLRQQEDMINVIYEIPGHVAPNSVSVYINTICLKLIQKNSDTSFKQQNAFGL